MAARIRTISAAFVLTAVLSAAHLVATTGAAWAGGSWMTPVQDRYEPGDRATLVGYVIGSGTLGSIADGPFYAYLRTTPHVDSDSSTWPMMAPFTPRSTDLSLGQLDVKATGKGGYLEYRVAIEFTIPPRLAPGAYSVVYCNADCSKGISDLIAGMLWIGVDPPYQLTRSWPIDEPEIANLAPTSTLSGPGWRASAAEIRATTPAFGTANRATKLLVARGAAVLGAVVRSVGR